MTAIPNVIHFTWVQGKDAMPPWAKFNVNTWRKHNPEAEIMIHDAASMLDCVLSTRIPPFIAAYKRLGSCFVQRKDFAQFAILYKFGGLHVDVDLQCQKPVHTLMQENTLLAFDSHLSPVVHEPGAALAIIGSVASHPVIRATMEGIGVVPQSGIEPETGCSPAYIGATARVWRSAFASMQQKYMSTHLQYFLQPAWIAGLDDPRSRTQALFRGQGVCFLTTPQGSWHKPFVALYHKSAVWGVNHKMLVLIIITVTVIALMVCAVAMLGVLLTKSSQPTTFSHYAAAS